MKTASSVNITFWVLDWVHDKCPQNESQHSQAKWKVYLDSQVLPLIFFFHHNVFFTKFSQKFFSSLSKNFWKALFSLPALEMQFLSRVEAFAASAHKMLPQESIKLPLFNIYLTQPNSVVNFCSTWPFFWGELDAVNSKAMPFPSFYTVSQCKIKTCINTSSVLILNIIYFCSSFINSLTLSGSLLFSFKK